MTLTAQQKPPAEPFDRANAFPAKMQSFPLYGDGAIPNSKPGPDEETETNTGWVQKVSRPMLEVYLPAKVKAVRTPDSPTSSRARSRRCFSSITGSRHLW
jgi:hypothetical protein